MTNKKGGYVVILVTLVILAVTVGITASLAFLSSGSLNIASSLRFGEQALMHSDACLEEGLLRLKNDPLYSGGTVDFPDGKCHIDVQNSGGTYTLQVYFAGSDKYYRPIEAKIENSGGRGRDQKLEREAPCDKLKKLESEDFIR